MDDYAKWSSISLLLWRFMAKYRLIKHADGTLSMSAVLVLGDRVIGRETRLHFQPQDLQANATALADKMRAVRVSRRLTEGDGGKRGVTD